MRLKLFRVSAIQIIRRSVTGWLVLALIGLPVGNFYPVFAESVAVLAARADLNCVNFHAVGVCRRNTPPYAGVKVRYRQPVLLIETVKVPGRVVVDELRPVMEQALGRAGRLAIIRAADFRSEPDSGGGFNSDTTSVQMNDVHVYGFPLNDAVSALILAPCEGAPDLAGPLSYVSELDAVEWRRGPGEAGHPMSRLMRAAGPACEQSFGLTQPGLCLGTWGPLFPRVGQVNNYSEAVGSAVAAYRAADIASLNMTVLHRVIVPSLFSPNMFLDRLQMVYPRSTSCLRIGENAALWENGRRSADGSYVWLYWRQKECCLF